jgi:uncharacterized protein (DUF169 family)
MEVLELFNKAIREYVRTETFPVAIKMVADAKEIPENIHTVKNQLDVTMALCQGWGKARFNGESVAMLKEDISCPVALFTLGLADPPQSWNEGDLYLNTYAVNQRAAANIARAMYKLPKGKYAGVVMAPIHACSFEPDLVLLYCTLSQLLRLLSAALCREGGRFENSIFPPGVCTDVIAPVIQTKKCRFGIPCFGDRKYEYTPDNELVFSAPWDRLEEIADGLKFFYETAHTIPYPRPLDHASAQLETYKKLRSIL